MNDERISAHLKLITPNWVLCSQCNKNHCYVDNVFGFMSNYCVPCSEIIENEIFKLDKEPSNVPTKSST